MEYAPTTRCSRSAFHWSNSSSIRRRLGFWIRFAAGAQLCTQHGWLVFRRSAAVARLGADRSFLHEITSSGVWYWQVARRLADYGPGDEIVGKGEGFNWGMNVVEQALNEIFGRNGWEKAHREYKGNSRVWVTAVRSGNIISEAPDNNELPFLSVCGHLRHSVRVVIRLQGVRDNCPWPYAGGPSPSPMRVRPRYYRS
jgi:hypothetical protein